jgi:putative oxidoreductase
LCGFSFGTQNERFLRHFRRALLVWPLKRVIYKTLSGLPAAARATYFGQAFVERPLSSVVRRSAAAGLFLLRAMAAIAVVSRHPAPHFVESGAVLLLLLGIWTPTAAAVVTGFELWLLAMRSGAWTSGLLAAMALAVGLIGPGGWSVDARWFGWRRIDIRRPRNSRPDAQSS